MKKLFFIPLALSFALFTSCGGEKETETEETETDKDSVEVSIDTVKKVVEEKVAVENMESIEAAENSTGMSFCDCVKKVQELDDKLMTEEDDKKLEAIMAEKEVLTNGDCKIIKAGIQNTPAQRAERARKVKACL